MTPRYIDAEKLLADNKEFADREFIHPKFQTTLRDIVNEQPTSDVAPVVHGHWETIFDELGNYGFEKCSACGDKYGSFTYRYCPNCGAKMDEVTDGGKE